MKLIIIGLMSAISSALSLTFLFTGTKATARSFEETSGNRLCDDSFFAMNISQKAFDEKIEQRLEWVKAAGFSAQHEVRFENMESIVDAYDAAGIRLAAAFHLLDLDSDLCTDYRWVPNEMEAVSSHAPLILLAIKGGIPSSKEHDAKVAQIVKNWSDIAGQYGLQIVLYPHAYYYLERFDDALRICTKVGRENVGVIFNLCHFLMVEPDGDWKHLLQAAADKLFAVTINGADHDGGDWASLIQPLDSGDFDVKSLLHYLGDIGFEGPIGLQDYGVAGEPETTLKRSLKHYLLMTENKE